MKALTRVTRNCDAALTRKNDESLLGIASTYLRSRLCGSGVESFSPRMFVPDGEIAERAVLNGCSSQCGSLLTSVDM